MYKNSCRKWPLQREQGWDGKRKSCEGYYIVDLTIEKAYIINSHQCSFQGNLSKLIPFVNLRGQGVEDASLRLLQIIDLKLTTGPPTCV